MKLLFAFILLSSVCFGQSKKDQIEGLNKTIDSLNIVLATTRDNSAKDISSLNDKIKEISDEVTALKSDLTNLQASNNKLSKENEKFKTDLEEMSKKNLELEAIEVEKVSFKSVILGGQVWMAENLNEDKFQNGDLIPEAKTLADWELAAENHKPMSGYYNNDPSLGKIYGKLYNWYAVNDPRGIAPKGWEIPKSNDVNTLVESIEGENGYLILKSNSGWNNGNGTDDYGFTALPSGAFTRGEFYDLGIMALWWCSDDFGDGTRGMEGSEYYASYYSLGPYFIDEQGFGVQMIPTECCFKGDGFSIRCIKK